jgi:hypothetical protein
MSADSGTIRSGHPLHEFQYEPNRLSLRCQWCGAETPGWRIDIRQQFRSDRDVVRGLDARRTVRVDNPPTLARGVLSHSCHPDTAHALAAVVSADVRTTSASRRSRPG